MLNYQHIKESAMGAGFDLVGICRPRDFAGNREWYGEWLGSGCAEPLSYMYKYMDVRFDPRELLGGARTAVVCALNYKNCYSCPTTTDQGAPQIASYALARDYHKVVRRALKALLKALQADHPALEGRPCVDTAPLLEKQLAHEAGLGWIGRSSLLVTPQFGTYVVLGVLLLSHDADHYDSPYAGNGCGECHRCVSACPTAAIRPNRTLDARRCLSALTVECDTPAGAELSGWIFGCDECQRCCPHNRATPLASNEAIAPIVTPPTFEQWEVMTPEQFAARAASTPLKRGGLERLQRNSKSIKGEDK